MIEYTTREHKIELVSIDKIIDTNHMVEITQSDIYRDDSWVGMKTSITLYEVDGNVYTYIESVSLPCNMLKAIKTVKGLDLIDCEAYYSHGSILNSFYS